MLDTRKYKSALRVFSFVFILAVVMLSVSIFATAAISAPQGVEANLVHNKVYLSWSEVTGAEEYKIYESTDNTTFTYLNNTTATNFIVNLNGKNAGTYYYKIEAVNGTDTNATVVSVKFYPPAAPQGLTAIVQAGKIKLSWNAVTGATGYYIYRGTEAGKESLLVSVIGTNYTDSDVTGGNTYYYYVTAYNATGESVASAEIEISVTSGGGTTVIKDVAFNTYLLAAGAILLIFALPVYLYGAKSHKDVAGYASIAGVILLLASWALERAGYKTEMLTVAGVALNSILAVLAVIFIIIGIVLTLLGEKDKKMKKHTDVGAFSLALGIIALLVSIVMSIIA